MYARSISADLTAPRATLDLDRLVAGYAATAPRLNSMRHYPYRVRAISGLRAGYAAWGRRAVDVPPGVFWGAVLSAARGAA